MARKQMIEGGTKNRIREVGGRQIFEHGYGGTSVRGIMLEVGGEVGLFYYYYKTKDELFTEILRKRDEVDAAHFGAVDVDDVRAEVSPQGKHDFVAGLQAAGAVVAMVGDGINDAPVLAKAQVSVAMGGGAQLARTQADLVLLSENLDHLRHGYRLARRALRVIRQNLWWSFAYNFVALPLAMVGLVTPWMAGIGMSGSSLLVVMNSLRLQRPDNP